MFFVSTVKLRFWTYEVLHSHRRYANGHISATGDPMHFMFGSKVGFSGTADRTALFTVQQIQDGGHRHVGKISSGDISATGRPIHFMFGYMVGFSYIARIARSSLR